MPPPSDKQLIVAHRAALAAVRGKVQHFALTAWHTSPGYRNADVDRLVARIVPVVLGGQQKVAGITDAYIAAITGGKPAGAATGVGSRGVDPVEVYRRPATTVYTRLANGDTFDDAVKAGADRLTSLAATDMQLASREQAQISMAGNKIVGYSRVVSGQNSCALCEIASTQRYTVGDLLPIHPGCSCDVAPIMGTDDPGQVINQERLDAIHGAAQRDLGGYDPSGHQMDYRKIAVRDHGEYGPTLSWRDQKFTGPKGLG